MFPAIPKTHTRQRSQFIRNALSSLRNMSTFAFNTYREAARDRSIAGFGLVISLLLLFTLALAELSLNENFRVIIDIGSSSVSVFSCALSVYLGSVMLHREIENKTIHLVLPKPVRRYEFFVGKLLGVTLSCAIFVIFSGAVFMFVANLFVSGGSWLSWLAPALAVSVLAVSMLLPWTGSHVFAVVAFAGLVPSLLVYASIRPDLDVLVSILLLPILEAFVLASVTMFFASFSSPLMAAFFSTGFWLIGRSAGMMAQAKIGTLPEQVVQILHAIASYVPNYDLFVPGFHTLSSTEVTAYLVHATVYAFSYGLLAIIAASLLFQRRELS